MSHDAYLESAAAYAIDALEPEARAGFEDHLAECDVCQAELAALRRTATAIGESVPREAPPAALRERTLARAVAMRQSAPPEAPARSAEPEHRRVRFDRLALVASICLAIAASVYALLLRDQVGRLEQLAADGAAYERQLREELATLRRDAGRLSRSVDVLSAPGAVQFDLRGQGAGAAATGRAFVSASGAMVRVERLPPLPAGRVYQLWVLTPDRTAPPVPWDTFTVDASGASAVVATLPAGATAAGIAVTIEPDGGSASATTPPVLVGTATR